MGFRRRIIFISFIFIHNSCISNKVCTPLLHITWSSSPLGRTGYRSQFQCFYDHLQPFQNHINITTIIFNHFKTTSTLSTEYVMLFLMRLNESLTTKKQSFMENSSLTLVSTNHSISYRKKSASFLNTTNVIGNNIILLFQTNQDRSWIFGLRFKFVVAKFTYVYV